MNTTLQAMLTRAHTGAPLATVDGLPGGCADLTPAQLRALAATLQRIAADAEARPTTGRHYMLQRMEYLVGKGAAQSADSGAGALASAQLDVYATHK